MPSNVNLSTVATFTRPNNTTAYTAGALVGTASVVLHRLPNARPDAASGMVTRIMLTKSSTNTTNATFRVHLFDRPPVIPNSADGVLLSGLSENNGRRIGRIDLTTARVEPGANTNIAMYEATAPGGFDPLLFDEGRIEKENTELRDITALIQVLGAYTPAANEVFSISLTTGKV